VSDGSQLAGDTLCSSRVSDARFGKKENDSTRFDSLQARNQHSRKRHARIITLMKSTHGQGILS